MMPRSLEREDPDIAAAVRRMRGEPEPSGLVRPQDQAAPQEAHAETPPPTALPLWLPSPTKRTRP
jgi:hypothetical protein